MGWPNDPAARSKAEAILRRWPEGSSTVPPRLGRIQHEWLRVADVTHLHYDIAQGRHQIRRGGASIGKAIALAAAITRSTGTGVATFWNYWKIYKDVAHLVTAATLICAEAHTRGQAGPFGLRLHQFLPFQMVMLMPDLVLAVGICLGATHRRDWRRRQICRTSPERPPSAPARQSSSCEHPAQRT